MDKFVVCLTGGIASGKTMVSDLMSLSGYHVIDADVVSREIVSKGQPVLALLVKHFGDSVLTASGELDRLSLKNMAFSDPSKLKLLNEITHPAIRARMIAQSEISSSKQILLVIPLFDSSMFADYGIDRLLVIDVDPEVQLKRISKRDQVDESLARKIVASQPQREKGIAWLQIY